MMDRIFQLLSMLYAPLVRLNRVLYSCGFFPSYRLKTPVISVGNITWGGTGKTPLVLYITKFLLEKGLKVNILTRGYGGKLSKTFGVVDPDALPGEVGDEPLFLRRSITSKNCQIIVGRDRYETSQLAQKLFNPDIFLLDDGFGNLNLKRNLDIVVIDALNPFGNGYLIPGGMLREPLDYLKRADVFLINRYDYITPYELNVIETRLSALSKPVFKVSPIFTGIYGINDDIPIPVDGFKYRDVIVVSGIGSPLSLDKMLLRQKFHIRDRLIYRDHYPYTVRDKEEIINRQRKSGGGCVLTTKKDWVKLYPLFKDENIPFYCIDIETKFSSDEDKKRFDEIISIH